MTREELIELLSEMHMDHSKDPKTLFAANFRNYNRNHPKYKEHVNLQGELYRACWELDEEWTLEPS